MRVLMKFRFVLNTVIYVNFKNKSTFCALLSTIIMRLFISIIFVFF